MKRKSILIGSLSLFLVTAVTVAAIATKPFTDVSTDHWAYEAIEEGRLSGLWEGFDDGTFGMGEAVTREQMAMLLQRNNEILKEEIMAEMAAMEVDPESGDTEETPAEEGNTSEEVVDCNNVNECDELANIPAKMVFVSSEHYQGDFGGINQADEICQSLADESDATKGGNYKAWISDSDTWPEKRFDTNWDGLYITTNGDVIAHGWDDLTDDEITHSVNYDEMGNEVFVTSVAGERVWTSTTTLGTPTGEHCEDWTSNSPVKYGNTGRFLSEDEKWSQYALNINCSNESRFYCFEQ